MKLLISKVLWQYVGIILMIIWICIIDQHCFVLISIIFTRKLILLLIFLLLIFTLIILKFFPPDNPAIITYKNLQFFGKCRSPDNPAIITCKNILNFQFLGKCPSPDNPAIYFVKITWNLTVFSGKGDIPQDLKFLKKPLKTLNWEIGPVT